MSTNSSCLPVIPNQPAHLRLMGQLAADAFSGGQYVDAYCDNYIGNSHYDWDVSRLVFDGGKLIHHWGVWGYQMRLETVQLKVGGIGAVVTHPDYRKQNIMHRAAQASFDAMKEDGYDLSILRGRHYVKMGYARAWNYVTYRFKLEDFPVTEPAPAYQPLGLEHVPEMDALYNRAHADFTGTAIRPTFYNKHPEDLCVHAWRDAAGNLAGYVHAAPAEEEPKTLLCLEAAGDPRQCLAVLAELFERDGYEKIACFTLPHLHPLLQHLRKGNCIAENRYFDNSGWRVRIINLHATLTKLAPLFEKRLENSQFASWTGSLRLDAGEQSATIQLADGNVAVSDETPTPHVLRGGAEIARFLIGSDEPDEIIRKAEMECSGLAQPLARALFPNLYPMLSHWDEY
ncbi:MAG: GNAT family N-acetyltransferase [Anaerolineae bacterium]|nr:GNAT family N-acetyltransferase [Anaerolineae bacterium]